jgi:hypothetical protein
VAEQVDEEAIDDLEERGFETDPDAYENVPSKAYITIKETKNLSADQRMHGHSMDEATKTGVQYVLDGRATDSMQVDILRQIAELWIRSNDKCCLLLERQRSSVRISE